MSTQLQHAREGRITKEIKAVACDEHLDPELVRQEVAVGRLVIPANINHKNLCPIGIGIATRCKVNANIGNSSLASDIEAEIRKLKIALGYGADAVMDLSTGANINQIREAIIANSPAPVGTVPIYHVACELEKIEEMRLDHLFDVIELQARQGVDFMTAHAGILLDHLPLVTSRLLGIVSRGGSLMARWMTAHKRENPLYTEFDRLLKIARRYDVTLSLGDGLRPGSLKDASDRAQFAELDALGVLVRRSWDAGVQVMVEGPGHIPFNEIEMNVKREIEVCNGAPFYVLGPLVTDVAAGYDHIASAIGGTMAAYAGASMLCYVTPKEHLGLPDENDVREGVIAHKIAAHAADVARGRIGAIDRDNEMSAARHKFDWARQFKLALDPKRAREYHGEGTEDYCSMCGPEYCPMRGFSSNQITNNQTPGFKK